jgi:hypothetical protein
VMSADGVSSGGCILHQAGGGAPVPARLLDV